MQQRTGITLPDIDSYYIVVVINSVPWEKINKLVDCLSVSETDLTRCPNLIYYWAGITD